MTIKNKPLSNVLDRYNNYLINLVTKDSIKDDDKKLLIEALLYLKVTTSTSGDDKQAAIVALDKYQDSVYVSIDPIIIGEFASIYADKGNYYFKFRDKDAAELHPLIKSFIKTQGFFYDRFNYRFMKKQSNLYFDFDNFLNQITYLKTQEVYTRMGL